MLKDIAYCGIKCSECPVYLATSHDDDMRRVELAEEYTSDHCHFEKEDINCRGCHSDLLSHKMCGCCEIRLCAVKREIATCAQCEDYPCEYIERYVPLESENRKRLDRLRRGL